MNVHRPSGRRYLGLLLALFTAGVWGCLPIGLKVLLSTLDPATITWARFLLAALVLLLMGGGRAGPVWRDVGRGYLALLLVATLGLCGNYVLYLMGLDYVSPSTAQIVIQLSPIFMMLGSLSLFGERFGRQQWLGLVALLCGLLLYFDDRLAELLFGLREMTSGVLLIVAAAAAWAAYALAQKQLLVRFSPAYVLLCLYGGGALLLLPLAHPAAVLRQPPGQLLLLAATAIATLASYRSFAGALQHLEGARVSIVISLTPLITMGSSALLAPLAPELIRPDRLSAVSMVGAGLVVVGSMCTAVGRRRGR